jgi:D-alanyl-D-alanine carboxypeptidase
MFGGKSNSDRAAKVSALLDRGFNIAPRVAKVVKPKDVPEKKSKPKTIRVTSAEPKRLKMVSRPPVRKPRDHSTQLASIDVAVREVVKNSANASLAGVRPRARAAVPAEDLGNDTSTQRLALIPIAPQKPSNSDGITIARAQSAGAGSLVQIAPSKEAPRRGWDVQLGAFSNRSKAERILLQVALQDLQALEGASRRVVPTRVKGIKVYQAKFVGLDREKAERACARLVARNVRCKSTGPGL